MKALILTLTLQPPYLIRSEVLTILIEAITSNLSGVVEGSTQIKLNWQAVNNASDYEIWKGEYLGANTTISFLTTATGTSFTDTNAATNTNEVYLIRSVNPNLTPAVSDFSNATLLRAHAPNRVDSVRNIGANQVLVYFTEAVEARESDKPRFRLNGTQTPQALITRTGKQLLLSFASNLPAGSNTLALASDFLDLDRGYIDSTNLAHNFVYTPSSNDRLYMNSWNRIGEQEVLINFNLPLGNLALDPNNYQVLPFGKIKSIDWETNERKAIRIQLQEVLVGALGYSVSITGNNLLAQNGIGLVAGEGNTATFSTNQKDLKSVFTYPSPVRSNTYFEGMRFANLTQKASIDIYTLSGRYVQHLEETDGDGGAQWNLHDAQGEKITTGVYLYKVTSNNLETFVGKFSVVE